MITISNPVFLMLLLNTRLNLKKKTSSGRKFKLISLNF